MPSIRTPGRRRDVIALLKRGHGLHGAALVTGCSYRSLADWRREDEDFRREGDEARDVAADVMVHALYQRGLAGDNLAALAWLRAYVPEKFNRKALENESPVVVQAEEVSAIRFYLPDNRRHLAEVVEAVESTEAEPESDAPNAPKLAVVVG
jgi:hypothetical protein